MSILYTSMDKEGCMYPTKQKDLAFTAGFELCVVICIFMRR